MNERTDKELLDGLHRAAEVNGECPGLVTNDAGQWAVARDGVYFTRESVNGADIQIQHVVQAVEWKPSIREAITAFLDSLGTPQ